MNQKTVHANAAAAAIKTTVSWALVYHGYIASAAIVAEAPQVHN